MSEFTSPRYLSFRRAVCVIACVGMALTALPGEASWDQYAGDAGNTRHVAGSLDPRTFALAWTHEYPYSESNTAWNERGVGSDGERVYFAERGPYIDLSTGRQYDITAVDLRTGQELWRTPIYSSTGNGVSEPTIYNGTVFINRSKHSSSVDPRLYRLDAQTGAVQGSTGYASQHGENFRVKPLGGALVAAAGYYGGTSGFRPTGGTYWSTDDLFGQSYPGVPKWEILLAGTDQIGVMQEKVFDPATGALLHTNTHPEGFKLVNPIVRGNDLYYVMHAPSGWEDLSSYARIGKFDLATGAFERDYILPGYADGVAIGPEHIGFKAQNGVGTIDLETGEVKQLYKSLFTYADEIVMTDTHVFVMDRTKVYAYDIARERITWSQSVENGGYNYHTHLAISDGMLLVADRQRTRAFRVAAPDPVVIAPTLDAGAQWNGASFDVTDEAYDISADRSTNLGIDKRMVMEFGLDAVPSSATVSAASLRLDIASFTSAFNNGVVTYGTLELYAYAGDGTLDPADATAGTTLVGSSEVSSLGALDIDLDTTALNALIAGGADYLGLLGVSGAGEQLFTAYTTEWDQLFGGDQAPRLTLEFDWESDWLNGDLDGDGRVNLADINYALDSFTGAGGSSSMGYFDGDMDGDGDVDNADLGAILGQATVPIGSLVAALNNRAVPEPSSLALLGFAMFGFASRTRKETSG